LGWRQANGRKGASPAARWRLPIIGSVLIVIAQTIACRLGERLPRRQHQRQRLIFATRKIAISVAPPTRGR
jgi:hypothetical protein